jgi:hypothetical protein
MLWTAVPNTWHCKEADLGKGGAQVSPAVVGIVVVVIVVVLGAVIWNMTAKKTARINNQDQMRQAVDRAMGSGSRHAPGGMMGGGMSTGGMQTTGGR